ncbi:MAG: hyaluronoglucosaminidase [Parcubacteria group bacterium Gr01-1014_66]|nr:MAG: hyaluronoglucosaminidase [Parcubacteria group bacterium Gr01-1014_66]
MHTQKYYGIVEGFFSDPLPHWTHTERLKTIDFITAHCPHFNTYFYTPKNDPWVEQRPFELYPTKKLGELRETVEICIRQNLTFIYGFNPAFILKTVENDFEAYIASILQKIFQLLSIGVRNFCILYDEIPFALNFDEAKISSENDRRIGKIHAYILNTLRLRLKDKIDKLWFCPPDYSFRYTTPYLSALLKDLDISIPIIWTGDGIFTKTISAELMKKGRGVVGKRREIIYWDNYPVNDCPHPSGTFHIGGFNAPSYAVYTQLRGIVVNPMRECFANLIAYLTLEAYLKNPRRFDRKKSLYAAFHTLLGAVWKPYANLYETFSDKNIADDKPRGYYAELLQVKSVDVAIRLIAAMKLDFEKLVTPRIAAGRSFIQTTNSVLKRGKNMHKIFSEILDGESWEGKFLLHDTFPVTLNKKYLTRQFTVLVRRVALADALRHKKSPIITSLIKMLLEDRFFIPEVKPTSGLEKQLMKLLGIFIKYQGKNRMNITREDTKKLFSILSELLSLEQLFFLQEIQPLPPLQKIHMLIRRSQINYY